MYKETYLTNNNFLIFKIKLFKCFNFLILLPLASSSAKIVTAKSFATTIDMLA